MRHRGRGGTCGLPGIAARVVSADSHVTEPADLWCERLDRAHRERAPRVVRDFARDRYLFVAPGIRPFAVASGFGAGKRGDELKRHLHRGYEAARPGGWDPAARLVDQDLDGVACEVLYPTHGMKLFALSDAALQRACFRVYNAWIAEFAAHAPDRLVALALISLFDVAAAVDEVARAAAAGARGVMIWGAPPTACRRTVSASTTRSGPPRRSAGCRCRCTRSAAAARTSRRPPAPPRRTCSISTSSTTCSARWPRSSAAACSSAFPS